jgi:hypothetical protein
VVSDEDATGTSRRLGFGSAVRRGGCHGLQQFSVGDCPVWRSSEECGGEDTGQDALTGLMGSLN